MTSYMIEIKQCPNCACKFQLWVTASCNTFGAKFYTDGFVTGAMYDEGSALLTCPGCNKYFWTEDVPTQQSMRDSKFFCDPERRSLPNAGRVGGRDYDELLDQSLWRTEAQEKYIRIRSWWSFNNGYRGHAIDRLSLSPEKIDKEFSLSPEQEDNLKKLLKLLDTNNPTESIMKAEIFRQLGEFDECLNQLDQAYDDSLTAAIDIITDLANSNSRKVGLIE